MPPTRRNLAGGGGGLEFTIKTPDLTRLQRRLERYDDKKTVIRLRSEMNRYGWRVIVPSLKRFIPKGRRPRRTHLRDTAKAVTGGGARKLVTRFGAGSKSAWWHWIVNARWSPYLAETLEDAIPGFYRIIDREAAKILREITRKGR